MVPQTVDRAWGLGSAAVSSAAKRARGGAGRALRGGLSKSPFCSWNRGSAQMVWSEG